MWILPPADDAGTDTTGRGGTDTAKPDVVVDWEGADGGGGMDAAGNEDGGGEDRRSRRRRALDVLMEVVRQPGTIMIAAGTTILASVAGIDDVAEALDNMSYVNADRAVGAGATVIISGVASLTHMFLAGRRIAEVKKAVHGNTDAINEMKAEIRSDLKTLIGSVNSMTAAINGLTEELRRGRGRPDGS